MKNVYKVLFGSLSMKKKTDYFVIPLKLLYIVYSLPLLLFGFMLDARSFGAFGSPEDEKVGLIKRVLMHFANIVFSFALWGLILTTLLDNFINL